MARAQCRVPAGVAPPALTPADLALCQEPCEHWRRNIVQEWCELDVGKKADGSPCQAAAVRAWAERMFGRRPRCAKQLERARRRDPSP
jgi:hypothetical protein